MVGWILYSDGIYIVVKKKGTCSHSNKTKIFTKINQKIKKREEKYLLNFWMWTFDEAVSINEISRQFNFRSFVWIYFIFVWSKIKCKEEKWWTDWNLSILTWARLYSSASFSSALFVPFWMASSSDIFFKYKRTWSILYALLFKLRLDASNFEINKCSQSQSLSDRFNEIKFFYIREWVWCKWLYVCVRGIELNLWLYKNGIFRATTTPIQRAHLFLLLNIRFCFYFMTAALKSVSIAGVGCAGKPTTYTQQRK